MIINTNWLSVLCIAFSRYTKWFCGNQSWKVCYKGLETIWRSVCSLFELGYKHIHVYSYTHIRITQLGLQETYSPLLAIIDSLFEDYRDLGKMLCELDHNDTSALGLTVSYLVKLAHVGKCSLVNVVFLIYLCLVFIFILSFLIFVIFHDNFVGIVILPSAFPSSFLFPAPNKFPLS